MADKRSGLFQQLSGVKGCTPLSLGCGSFVLFFIVIFVLFDLFAHFTTPNANTLWDVKNHQLLKMRTERGVTESIHIEAGVSISGYWATDGLQLMLNTPDHAAAGVVSAKAPNWSNQIVVTCSSNFNSTTCPSGADMVLDGMFIVPYIAGPVAQTVTGNITGTIYWPHDLGNGKFDTKSTNIDVPVQLILGTFSPYETFMQGPDVVGTVIWISSGIAIVLALALAIQYRRFLKRKLDAWSREHNLY